MLSSSNNACDCLYHSCMRGSFSSLERVAENSIGGYLSSSACALARYSEDSVLHASSIPWLVLPATPAVTKAEVIVRSKSATITKRSTLRSLQRRASSANGEHTTPSASRSRVAQRTTATARPATETATTVVEIRLLIPRLWCGVGAVGAPGGRVSGKSERAGARRG